MKKFAIIFFFLTGLWAYAYAQTEDLAKIQELLKDNRVSADYSFTYGGKLKCSGVITIQDPFYKAEGNGIEIYCDGKSRWTVDREAKEVYIESVAGPQDYLQYLSDISGLQVGMIKKEPRSSATELFIFDERGLDSSWVVTDLR